MNTEVIISIYRPAIEIAGVNGFFSVVGDETFEHVSLVSCDACEGAPGRWEYDPSVVSEEHATAIVRTF